MMPTLIPRMPAAFGAEPSYASLGAGHERQQRPFVPQPSKPPAEDTGGWRNRPPRLPERLESELTSISQLKTNWDEAGTDPIQPQAVQAARVLLIELLAMQPSMREPMLVPTPDGSIQIEWHEHDRTLELGYTGERWIALGVELGASRGVTARLSTSFSSANPQVSASCYAWFVHRNRGRAPWPSR